MFAFNPAPSYYRNTGLVLAGAGFFLFIAALPPFQQGLWLQTEPVVLMLFAIALASAIWLFTGICNGWLWVQKLHPLWLCALAWLAWQNLILCWATNPWRSWFGPPETGEGTGWYLSGFILSIIFAALWEDTRARRLLLQLAVASLLIQAGLHMLNPLSEHGRYIPRSWRPASWAAYLAFMAGFVWIAVATSSLRHWVLACVTAIILLVSQNLSACILLGSALLFTLLLQSRARMFRRLFYPHRRWRITLFAISLVLPFAWLFFSLYGAPDSLRADKDGSIGSRIALNQMAASALEHEPERWLGKGWGGFSDVTFSYALIPGVHVYENGVRAPNSWMVDGYSFHSHNQPLEALLALGVPGMLLWLAFYAIALWTLPKRQFWLVAPMLLGLEALSCLWFELAQCVPYQALAFAALACAPSRNRVKIHRYHALPLLAFCIFALAWSVQQQHAAMRYGVGLRDAAHAMPYQDYADSWVEEDIARGGDRLRQNAQFFISWLALKSGRSSLDANDAGWYAAFQRAAHTASESSLTGASVASLDMRMDYALQSPDAPVLAELKAHALQSLPSALLHMAERAPLRDDLATPYLLSAGNKNDLLHPLLTIAPGHRPALWLSNDHKAASCHPRWSGVEDVYPLTDQELTAPK